MSVATRAMIGLKSLVLAMRNPPVLCASSPSVSCTFARRLSSAFSAIITSSTETAPAPRLAICFCAVRAASSS